MALKDYFSAGLICLNAKLIDMQIKPTRHEKKDYKLFIKSLDKNCKNNYGLINSLTLMKAINAYPYSVDCEIKYEGLPLPLCLSFTIESIINEDIPNTGGIGVGRTYDVKLPKNLSKIFSEYLTNKVKNDIVSIKAISLSFKF